MFTVFNTNLMALESLKLTFARGQDAQSDLNNLRETGLYRYGTKSVSNLPDYTVDAYFVLVFQYDADYVMQLYTGYRVNNTMTCYTRAYWAGVWKSWLQLG